MVQVSRRSCIGKIKYCHIHDLLRDLAIQRAKEDNFLTVVSKNDTKLSCSTRACRGALHSYGDKLINHSCKENLRSLINFGDVPNFKCFGKLCVLQLSTSQYEYLSGANGWKSSKALTALKYFGVEGYDFCCIFEEISFNLGQTVRYMKKSSPLTYMKKLQTVHVCFSKSHGELPVSFWGNKQLRYINLACCSLCKAPWGRGTNPQEGPPSTANLQSLLSLKGVSARQDWVAELPSFPNNRKLGIVIPKDVAWEPLINLLSNLNHLGSLHLVVKGNNKKIFPCLILAFRNHNRLHSFKLVLGIWPRKDVDCTLFPPHLVKLTLVLFEFEEDPMPQLEKLPNLRVLKISYSRFKAPDKQQMICSRGGFGCLQQLNLGVINLEELKIEEGAMPMLNQLLLFCKFQKLPDLQYLVNLQELTVRGCDPRFQPRLQGEEQWKIKHIPSVILHYCPRFDPNRWKIKDIPSVILHDLPS